MNSDVLLLISGVFYDANKIIRNYNQQLLLWVTGAHSLGVKYNNKTSQMLEHKIFNIPTLYELFQSYNLYCHQSMTKNFYDIINVGTQDRK